MSILAKLEMTDYNFTVRCPLIGKPLHRRAVYKQMIHLGVYPFSAISPGLNSISPHGRGEILSPEEIASPEYIGTTWNSTLA
jgi:hypothetical protein